MSLSAVEAAVERGELRAALQTALSAWREKRQPEWATLAEAIAAKLATPPFAPLNAKAMDFQARWLEALREDPTIHLSFAMETFTRGVPVEDVGSVWGSEDASQRKYAAWLARVSAVKSLADDPRLGPACVDVIRRLPWDGVTANAFDAMYRPVLERLAALRDVRQLDLIRQLGAHSNSRSPFAREFHAEVFAPLAERLSALDIPPLPPAEASGMAALLRSLTPPRATPLKKKDDKTLFALVLANPEDDGPREVLADFWTEHGVAQGDFVTLQLRAHRNEGTPAEEKRMRSLIWNHEAVWLGALQLVSKNRHYHRGFLDVLELHQNHFASDETWDAALAEPALGTVSVIHKGKCNATRYRAFTRAAPNLRGIEVVSKAMLAELSDQPPSRVTHLRLEFALDRAVLDQVSAFPALSSLTVSTTRPAKDRVLAEKLLPRLRRIELQGPEGSVVLGTG